MKTGCDAISSKLRDATLIACRWHTACVTDIGGGSRPRWFFDGSDFTRTHDASIQYVLDPDHISDLVCYYRASRHWRRRRIADA